VIADESDAVGACPRCETPVPPSRVLIEYEADGERRLFAECPDCRDVVDPHAASQRGRVAASRPETAEE
jgi:hypothetical protein